jgi:DNA-binding transcriptional regulator GbsR (MarR family)
MLGPQDFNQNKNSASNSAEPPAVRALNNALTPAASATIETTAPQIWAACEAVADMIEFWGFKRVLGRVWMLLYLQPQNLAAADIARLLGMSTGAVSMALKEMEQWGIVIKANRSGSRQLYYQAETNLWRMFSRVIRNREIHHLDQLARALNQCATALEGYPSGGFALERLRTLERLVTWGSEGLRLLFQENGLEPSALQRIAQLRSLFQKL